VTVQKTDIFAGFCPASRAKAEALLPAEDRQVLQELAQECDRAREVLRKAEMRLQDRTRELLNQAGFYEVGA
jgi:hypothetical protein